MSMEPLRRQQIMGLIQQLSLWLVVVQLTETGAHPSYPEQIAVPNYWLKRLRAGVLLHCDMIKLPLDHTLKRIYPNLSAKLACKAT